MGGKKKREESERRRERKGKRKGKRERKGEMRRGEEIGMVKERVRGKREEKEGWDM